MSILNFHDPGTEDIFNGVNSRRAGRTCPPELHDVARKRLDSVSNARLLADLSRPPNHRLEALKDDRKGQHSIRVNDQYRVCFRWTDAGAADVAVVDYH